MEAQLFAGDSSIAVVPEVVTDSAPVSSEADLQSSLHLFLRNDSKDGEQAEVPVYTRRVGHCRHTERERERERFHLILRHAICRYI